MDISTIAERDVHSEDQALSGARSTPLRAFSMHVQLGKQCLTCNRFLDGACQSRHSFMRYSHSIVPGGLLVMSYVTRFTPRTSFTMRPATRVRNAMSNGYTSAVMPSVLVTARSAHAMS